MDQKEFAKLCITCGFSKVDSHYYARCVGDGILQTIYTGRKAYISPSSPYYSPQNRKSYTIILGLYSLYSPWKESLFAPGIHSGLYYPDSFLPNPPKTRIFHGVFDEYTKMKENVFPALDLINTQEELLDLYCAVQKSKSGARIHDLSLVAPFLICGRTEDAIFELCYHYMHCREGFRKTHMNLMLNGAIENYYQQELVMLDSLSVATELWDAMLSQNYDRIQRYLSENYNSNMNWVNKYKISKVDGLFFRDAPEVF